MHQLLRLFVYWLCVNGILSSINHTRAAEPPNTPEKHHSLLSRSFIIDHPILQNLIITTVHVDSLKRMWIGTEEGVYRYDGFRVEKLDETFVSDGQLPIGPTNRFVKISERFLGINSHPKVVAIFDMALDRFVSVSAISNDAIANDENKTRLYLLSAHTLDNGNILLLGNLFISLVSGDLSTLIQQTVSQFQYLNLIQQTPSRIWVSNRQLAMEFSRENGALLRTVPLPQDYKADRYLPLYLLSNGETVHFFAANQHYLLSPKSDFSLVNTLPECPLSYKWVRVSSLAQNKALYVNTCGIYRYDLNTHEFESLSVFSAFENTHQFYFSDNYDFQNDKDKAFFIKTAEWLYWVDSKGNISREAVNFRHSDGNYLWFDHFNELGLSKLSIEEAGMELFSENISQFNGITSNELKLLIGTDRLRQGLFESPNILWIATQNAGLHKLVRQSKTDSWHAEAHYLDDSQIRALWQDGNNLWVGSEHDGVHVIDVTTGIRQQLFDSEILPSGFGFLALDDKRVIVNMLNTGLVILNRQNFSWISSPKEYSTLPAYVMQQIRAMEQTKDGHIWLATHSPQFPVLELDKQLELVSAVRGEGPTAAYHFDITHSTDATLWIATWGQGLLYRPAGSDAFLTFDTKQGLPSNVVFAVYEVKPGELWITTENGLVQLQYHDINQPDSFKLRVFDKRDGLSTALFDSEAHHRQADGTLVFSGYGGIVWFDPLKDIAFNSRAPAKPYISGISVNGQAWPGFVSAWSFAQHPELILPNDAGAVRIQFAAPSYLAPAKNRYQYRLNQGDWQSVEQPEIQFASLASGTYRLEISATNNDGLWTNDSLYIKLDVPVPWWAQWWAFVLYSLAIFMVTMLAFVLRNRRIVLLNQQLENKVIQRTEQLQQAIDSKEQLFEEISHEFRTPLTLILGKSEQLQNGNEAQNRELGIIHRNAQRMYELVEKLLKLAELQVAQKQAVNTPVYQVLNQSIEHLLPLAQSKGITIKSDLNALKADDDYLLVEESLELIANNLISNAIKYSPDNSTISVCAKLANQTIELSISDQGPGFSQPETATGRFKRQNNREAGNGLGLAIVQKMVEANQGELSLQNGASGGAQVKVRLIAKQILAIPRPDLSELPQACFYFPTCHILIVEDNTELRQHLVDILPTQARVSTAENGLQALILLENELPDLILSDVMMPSMNGFELCAKVKADEDLQHIPFILLTAKTDPKSQHYGLQQQADDYIGKPFSSDALLQRLANKLNTHFALKQKLQTELLSTPVEKNVTNIVQQKIHDLLALNFSREDFTITELANELGMSDKTLTRKLKVLFNCTFSGLLKDYRLNVACEMLKAGKPVKEVAFMCGFNSQAYFGAMFKQKYQQTPGSFATGPKKILK